MIELVYGLQGDGKSYSACKMVVDLLAKQACYVCTNVPMGSVGQLAEYYEAKGIAVPDLSGRLRRLAESEVGRFWRHLAPGWSVPGGTDKNDVALPGSKQVDLGNGRMLIVPDYDAVPNDFPGVCYVLDEAHIHFSAYKWAEISEEVTWAVSQHRHLGMEVVLVSQHPEKIAKALRRDIHRYTRIKNFGNRRTLGFVASGRFRRVTYPELPARGSENMIEEASWFRFDPALAALYSTNAGVGITAKVFQVERKPKGLPLKSLFVIIPALLGICFAVPFYGSRLVGAGLGAVIGSGSRAASRAVCSMASGVKPTNVFAGALSPPVLSTNLLPGSSLSFSRLASAVDQLKAESDRVAVVSYAWCALAPEACTWTLSTGEVVDRSTAAFQAGGKGWCVVGGIRYDYHSKSDGRGLGGPGGGSVAGGHSSAGIASQLSKLY